MSDLRNSATPPDPVQQAAAEALNRGDVEAAFAVYETALRQDADNVGLAADYGFLLWRTYEFDRGQQLFTRLLDNPRTDLAMLKTIAKRYFEIGRFSAAADAMRIAVARADPMDSESAEIYAAALERDNQIELAQEQAQRAISINPSSCRAARLLAHIDNRHGQYEQAVRRLRDHLRNNPSEEDWRLRYELASSLDRLEQFDDAWRELSLAKAQLAPLTKMPLRDSYRVRQRQWEFARTITDADLSRWFRESEQPVDPPLRLTLLAGFPRSGTTLLEQLIASHVACIGTDESGILASQFTAPMIWTAKSVSDAILEVRSLTRHQLSAGREAYLRLTQAYLGESIGDRLLIEKDPLLTPDLAIPLRLFPDASLLMPLRDPRDVIVSYCFTMVPLSWNSAPAMNPLEAVRFYADCMRHWLLLRQRIACPWHEVRYEDLAAAPTETLRHVVDFLGLPWDPTMLDLRQRSERRAVRTPTYIDIARPISSRAVGRWTHYAQYLEPSIQLLQPYLKAFGYN